MTDDQSLKKAALTEGAIGRLLVKLSIPMFFGIVAALTFNLVDTFFISLLGVTELAAISFTFPVVMFITGLSMGLGTGASALISRAIGEGDTYRTKRLTSDSLALSLLIVLIFIIAGMFTIRPVFTLLGADAATLPLIESYMEVWYPGMLFLVVSMVGNNAIRSTGDMKTPGMIMVASVAINVALDPLLIFGLGPVPAFGMAGAAWATVIARAITFFISLHVLYRRDKMLVFTTPPLAEAVASWKRILFIGIPSAATNMITPVAMAVITRLVSGYGTEAVAGFGVAGRVEALTLTVIMALVSVLNPFIGQNMGGGKLERVFKGISGSIRFSFLYVFAVWIALAFTGKYIGAVFNDSDQVQEVVQLYFWLSTPGLAFFAFVRINQTALNVLNKPLQATMLMAVQMFVLHIPLAWTGAEYLGVWAVFLASTIAAGLNSALSFSFFWYRKYLGANG